MNGISVQSVTKTFRVYDEQYQTLKERAIHFGKIPFHEFEAVSDVSFEAKPGSMVGILGHNGSGKSTLLKCIAGTLTPNHGKIVAHGRMAALLELGAGFHPELTGRENLYLAGSILGLRRHEIQSKFDQIVDFAELEEFIDNQMKHYSSGMFTRLGFALIANIEPEILLLDEVLAVGDEAFQNKCLDQIRSFREEGVTILFVTHSVDLAASLCDELVVLDHGKVVASGDPTESAATYRRHLYAGDKTAVSANEASTEQISFPKVSLLIDGAPATVIRPGDTVTLQVETNLDHDLEDAVIAYAIREAGGELVNSSNTRILDVPGPKKSGPSTYSFTFEGLPLLNGHYSIDIGAHSLDGQRQYAQLNEAAHFTMVGPSRESGISWLPVRGNVS